MLKIHYFSDLHLEFQENTKFIHFNKFKFSGDICILAGDITYYNEIYFKNKFFDYLSDNFQMTYYIPGNHEFYCGKDVSIMHKSFSEKIRENVILLNNQVIPIKNHDFIFTSLWSYIPEGKAFITKRHNDFYKIMLKDEPITYQDYNQLHRSAYNFLLESMKSNTRKKIIVTHHLPTFQCMASEYIGDDLNYGFVVNLDDFIEHYKPDYWIYGHTHRNIEKKVFNTKFLSNQLGYVHMAESFDFHFNKYFVI